MQRICNCSKIKTPFLLQIKYWTFWYMDYSALIKFNTLENASNGRNMWTVNNGWVFILVKYGFIRLLQRIFNCDKMHNISITSDEVWTVWYMDHLSASSYYTSYKLSNMVRFWYFWRSMASPNSCQEYLNMATFWILVLFLIKSLPFWCIDRFLTSSYTGVVHF